jgi:hypothetical protein
VEIDVITVVPLWVVAVVDAVTVANTVTGTVVS